LLLGVFHFANPGRDVVRVDQINVLAPESQAYLEQLADRLCACRPTTILLEFDRAREPDMRSQLDAYRADGGELGANENYQIGFRVAETCGVEKLYGFDESEIGWDAEPLFQYLEQSAPDRLEAFNNEIASLQAAEAAAHGELDLRELLIRANDPEQERMNKDLYLLTNAAGAGFAFEGADATARWWHRNIRMYANIQRYAAAGERVLVIAGQGHTAILRDFLKIDRRIVARDIRPYLQSNNAPPDSGVWRNGDEFMAISCHLSFNGQCETAFRAYQAILGGEVRTLLSYGESPLARQVPAEWQSRILHATLVVGDEEFLGSDAFPDAYERPQGFCVTFSVPDLARARQVFESLAAGGTVQMPFQETFWSPGFGVLTDRFGVPWEVNSESPVGRR
jgi:uncharacterized glyoxalase superfamily protein PhnB